MNESSARERCRSLFQNASKTLLSQRTASGHWEGELSSSALSTATAIIALEMALDASSAAIDSSVRQLIEAGRRWLAATQNSDGGWGDTVLSKSNISTTALVWAAFSTVDRQYPETTQKCESWLREKAGDLSPHFLARAIADRYGKDRTFSVPILTTLALRGRLGDPSSAWRLVPQLPFELAAFPQEWYALLRLPVVSYALPALIAIGQVKHHVAPTWNPLTRSLRVLTRQRTLNVLNRIQPASGGFLEATPLTSFVVLSLIGAGLINHPVVTKGLQFLTASARDGSWPIDTNLATWVTTLSVNALSSSEELEHLLSGDEQSTLLHWISRQQYQQVHPYTNAAPGGWAWTDLSGGVPDADDTPGALLSLRVLRGASLKTAAAAGVRWLLDLQNRDGGIPTFCRGWGVLPFDRSSADLTAHALRAWSIWFDHLPSLARRIEKSAGHALAYLQRTQRADGAWSPLWFGNQHCSSEENLTYGTSRVVIALATMRPWRTEPGSPQPDLQRAITWLIRQQNSDGGWGGGESTNSSIEETALAVEALASVAKQPTSADNRDILRGAIERGLEWLIEHTNDGQTFDPTPIGFYFAKLWYYEKLYPVMYTVAAAGRALSMMNE